MHHLLRFCALFLFFSLVSCGKEQAVSPEGASVFQVSDPSHLFFKNMRSNQYIQTTQPNTRIDQYRLRQWDLDKDRPLLVPVIVDNWMQDEAYLFVETNAYQPGFAEPLTVQWSTEEEQGQIALEQRQPADQRTFLLAVYDAIDRGANLQIRIDEDQYTSLFENTLDQLYFRKTVKDYLRLTE